MTTPSLSLGDMLQNTGSVVLSVMILLVFGCLLTWTICIVKIIQLATARQKLYAGQKQLRDTVFLNTLKEASSEDGITGMMIMATLDEYKSSQDILNDTEGLKERIVLALERLEANEERRLMRGTGLLATIGATAPFIGLFGTVWGIMNSFTGIAAAKATSLAVVAPGIAEALLATAIGLVTAIPAVIIYNALSRKASNCRGIIADISVLILRLVSRDLSHRQQQVIKNKIGQFSPRIVGK